MSSFVRFLANIPLISAEKFFLGNTRSPIELPQNFINLNFVPEELVVYGCFSMKLQRQKETLSIGLLRLTRIQGTQMVSDSIGLLQQYNSGQFCRKLVGKYESKILKDRPVGSTIVNLLGVILSFSVPRVPNQNLQNSNPAPFEIISDSVQDQSEQNFINFEDQPGTSGSNQGPVDLTVQRNNPIDTNMPQFTDTVPSQNASNVQIVRPQVHYAEPPAYAPIQTIPYPNNYNYNPPVRFMPYPAQHFPGYHQTPPPYSEYACYPPTMPYYQ